MSRSNATETSQNPCQHWFQWSSDKACFQEWDKEKKENKTIPFPFRFLVIEKDTFTVKGYSEADKAGYYSNEVKSSKDKITVRTKSGIAAEGTYEEIKAKLGSKGAKYSQSVYIMFYDNNKVPTLGNIQLSGAALGPWIELQKTAKVMECGLVVKTTTEGKKGKVVFSMPVFETMKVSEESNNSAVELDKVLQGYLSEYFAKNNSSTVASTVVHEEAPTAEKAVVKPAAKVEKVDDVVFGDGSDDPPF